ncbi:hypothetical protein NE236_08135 [Actinoallomurus purpureus]|uniref:hypothetical protein n=1 Tax=Actinoallomurus purpureus TaxID=478114 RepID=UPI002091F8B5|nr:hypothetical protein [Actinoallomurus purpureus]MCO6004948.1 hypothetical protein [Actinoallomurus purpureus]
MPEIRRVVHRIVNRRVVGSHRLVADLERWERLATPEERARLLAKSDLSKAA